MLKNQTKECLCLESVEDWLVWGSSQLLSDPSWGSWSPRAQCRVQNSSWVGRSEQGAGPRPHRWLSLIPTGAAVPSISPWLQRTDEKVPGEQDSFYFFLLRFDKQWRSCDCYTWFRKKLLELSRNTASSIWWIIRKVYKWSCGTASVTWCLKLRFVLGGSQLDPATPTKKTGKTVNQNLRVIP